MKFLIPLLMLTLLFAQCKKDSFTTSPDALLSTNVEGLKYDTVFVNRGSITQSFKIFNPNNKKLLLSSVKLMGGTASYFKINVDGIATALASDIEINANDSIYVFVQVNVDPSFDNVPFVIRDSIQINFNGNERFVQLEAWGQNAHFFRDKEITGDEVWSNDLPYVILGYLHVNPGASLTLEKGTRIYVHSDAPTIVEGSLITNGEKDSLDHVIFQSDRLDAPYAGYPAGWPGLYFAPSSKDNILNFTNILNAYQAIAIEGPTVNANPKLRLNETKIDNAYDAGILALNSSVSFRNCLISNCGKNVVLTGGNYEMLHTTVASFSNNYIIHKAPVLNISNGDGTNTYNLSAIFQNCIFWGDNGQVEDEVVISKSGSNPFSINFDHVLWKQKNEPANSISSGIINNQPPLFDSIDFSRRIYNLRLQAISPAIDAGLPSSVTIDLDGNPRPIGAPDLGAYEND